MLSHNYFKKIDKTEQTHQQASYGFNIELAQEEQQACASIK